MVNRSLKNYINVRRWAFNSILWAEPHHPTPSQFRASQKAEISLKTVDITVYEKLFQRGFQTGSVWGQLGQVYRTMICSKQQKKAYSHNMMEINQNWRHVAKFAQNFLKPSDFTLGIF
jgi:hypothetical protein